MKIRKSNEDEKDRSMKLPSEQECEEYAQEIADELRPLGSWDSEKLEWIRFTPNQLARLIKFCKGEPIQKEMFNK